MQILVTGGAGFIGSHLVRWLVAQGHTVRVFDNLSTGKIDALDSLVADVELIVGDIRDAEQVCAAAQSVEVIFHLAAMVSVQQSMEQVLQAQAVNATGTLHVLEAARQNDVRRVVQASSCAVYGDPSHLPIDENTRPQPCSPYAATKLAAEQAGQLYSQLYGVETVALRFFNVYGPGQDPWSPYAAVVPRFIMALLQQQPLTIYGDGQQSRDFIFVADVVRALWTAATTPGIAGQVFNIGRGSACSVLHLAETIGDVLGVAIQPTYQPARAGEVRHSWADPNVFAYQTGFRAQTELPDGIAATVAAWR